MKNYKHSQPVYLNQKLYSLSHSSMLPFHTAVKLKYAEEQQYKRHNVEIT